MVSIKEIDAGFAGFKNAVVNSPYLDAKTKELIAFSNSAIIDCKPCMELHYKGALGAGAASGEIAEAIALAMAVAAGKIKLKTNEILREKGSMAAIEEIDNGFAGFKNAVVGSPHLNAKTKELIAFSNSAIIDCKPCMELHYKGAVGAGATSGEIAEAIALAMAVAAGKIKLKTNEIVAG